MKLKLYTKEEILNVVEFNFTGDNENFVKCDQESKYLPIFIFNIFSDCFETAEPLFEIFGQTKYNSRKIVPLKNQILKRLREIEEIHSLDVFKKYICQTFLGEELITNFVKEDPEWERNWEIHHESVVKVGEELVDMVDNCLVNDLILWVIGL